MLEPSITTIGYELWIRGERLMDQSGEHSWVLALSQHRTCGADHGDPHKEAPKVLEKLRTHQVSLVLSDGLARVPSYPSQCHPNGELGWNQPLCRRAPGCRQLPILGVPLTVLSHSKSLTCPGLKGCLRGKEEWQEMWHKFNSKLNFPSHSAGKKQFI